MEEKQNSKEINEKIRDLVIARIEARMSPNLRLSIGQEGSLDKEQLIEHVKKLDSIGKQIIKVHLNFMKAQASGQLASALNTV